MIWGGHLCTCIFNIQPQTQTSYTCIHMDDSGHLLKDHDGCMLSILSMQFKQIDEQGASFLVQSNVELWCPCPWNNMKLFVMQLYQSSAPSWIAPMKPKPKGYCGHSIYLLKIPPGTDYYWRYTLTTSAPLAWLRVWHHIWCHFLYTRTVRALALTCVWVNMRFKESNCCG